MSYFAPYIDEQGYHYPTYNDILEALVERTQRIFGSGVYLGSDSQDYELLAVYAEMLYDCYQTGEIQYNSHSPVTAIGAGLDYIVALSGLRRRQATRSTVELTLTGDIGTVISGGAVSDSAGNIWDLPSTVQIGDTGTTAATATCRALGVVQAEPNTVTHIMTPTLGWTGVTNPSSAEIGAVAETDSELRARQAESVAAPSQSVLSGLKGAINALTDVSRVQVYENDTAETDARGIPGHSICCVVEGGDSAEIAQAIYLRKAPGCGTFSGASGEYNVNETVLDGDQAYQISFSRLEPIEIEINVSISRRAGYSTDTPANIKAALVGYLDEFTIGTDLTTSIIWAIAQSVNKDLRAPTFSVTSVTAAKLGETPGAADVEIGYDQVAHTTEALITVSVS